MTINVTCASCQREIRAKEEYAGKRVRCPGCQNPVLIPAAEIAPLTDLGVDWEKDLGAAVPAAPVSPKTRLPAHPRPASSSTATAPWYRRHWHWLVVAAVLLLALWPRVGFGIAFVVFLVGALMAVVGGLIPMFQILIGAPGTVLMLILSRSARFEMMRQPDDHPYKVLVRSAGKGTRGILWRGVLFMVVLIPAAMLQGLGSELFRHRAPDVALDPNRPPPPFGPHHAQMAMGNNPIQPMPAADPAMAAQNAARMQAPPAWANAPRQAMNASASGDRLTYVTLTYRNYDGTQKPAELIESVIGQAPGFVSGSLTTDEVASSVSFQYRGHFDLNAFGAALAHNGMRTLGMRQTTERPE